MQKFASTKTILLVGGYGTRLRKAIPQVPKAMAEVGGVPFLEYLVYQLSQQGFRDMIFCIGYLGEKIKDYFRDGRRWSVNIKYSIEKELLGTAGAVKLAAKGFGDENFLVINGDTFMTLEFNTLIKYHLKKMAIATIALAKVNNVMRFGKVITSRDNLILQFSEKGNHGPGYINGGIYVFNRKILEFIPEGKKVSLEKDIFPKLISNKFYGRKFPRAYFVDIGT
ncbi:MAG: nucleotidyltransferase family protein, partial [candidate division WOR-3 bacterium]